MSFTEPMEGNSLYKINLFFSFHCLFMNFIRKVFHHFNHYLVIMHRPVITPYLLTINFLCKKNLKSLQTNQKIFFYTHLKNYNQDENKKPKHKWVIVWKHLHHFNCFVVSISPVEDMHCITRSIHHWRDEFWWKPSVGKLSHHFLSNAIYHAAFLWFY